MEGGWARSSGRWTLAWRNVALKILSPEHAADKETVLRFQNEAQSAARLDHDNIARVYYVGEDRGLHYIVFEFIEGINVRDLVESKGRLSLADAVSYTLQVADALAHAAQRNVVHRDIKPSNLLITPSGQAKLIDMGLARLREVDAAAADLTASGVTLGTFDYISPEQARDPRNADVRSDIYSLGCTFFFMLTGRPPFLGGTMLQKLLQHQADQPPDLRQFRPELPEDVNRILRKMLAKDPRRRYASPQDFVNDLLWVSRAAGLRPSAPGGRAWTVPLGPVVPAYYRHLPWIVSLTALVVIVLALDYVWPYMPARQSAARGNGNGQRSCHCSAGCPARKGDWRYGPRRESRREIRCGAGRAGLHAEKQREVISLSGERLQAVVFAGDTAQFLHRVTLGIDRHLLMHGLGHVDSGDVGELGQEQEHVGHFETDLAQRLRIVEEGCVLAALAPAKVGH